MKVRGATDNVTRYYKNGKYLDRTSEGKNNILENNNIEGYVMWHDLNITKVSCIEKTVAEFTVTMIPILPYAKMKIKIYEDQSGFLQV
ncbi:hypothetical protein PrNR1418_12970 [Providencia rettgeri]|nr:hypothetical protein PrNR1418_12970 [Providencia rettgeri]